MFDAHPSPRVFAVPLGVDFSAQLYQGLHDRFSGMAPTDIAKVEVFVNTRRMQRRLAELFHQGPASLLPKIRLVTDLGDTIDVGTVPPAVAPLRRRLEVAQLVKGLINADPTLAPKEAAFDLADSLVKLMGEMQGEGVSPDVISGLDIADQSGHWQRSLKFIQLVQGYFGNTSEHDPEARQRRVIEAQIARWAAEPPIHPIVVAGSTGSRGTTSLFMQAVASLPQGAVILPGVDQDMPAAVWDRLIAAQGGEDHSQYRFKAFCDALDLHPTNLLTWGEAAPNRHQTALVSLSLRPAPVTDQWIKDGAKLTDLGTATADLTLIEAPNPRAEAEAIAVRLRQAVEDGQTAALITPDRMLTRQVTAALDRWDISPDDSAGLPLQLSAPGRLLRHVADVFCEPLDAERLLVLLRHPLTHSGADGRGTHILNTNALELELRRYGPAFPHRESLLAWAEKTETRQPGRRMWADWVAGVLMQPNQSGSLPLASHLDRHIQITEALSNGPDADTEGELWKEGAGREALRIMTELQNHSDAGGEMTAREYRHMVGFLLSAGEVRNPDRGHPNVLIWGTLEARVQAADLIIIAGLNEGTWPEAPAPDPWLNRTLRMEAGLLLPERRIGLSAHDYQQAICGKKVVISRAIRSDEAETVPSRWINRLTNLLDGLTTQGGPDYLKDMRERGQHWIRLAQHIAQPAGRVPPAARPSPRPPVSARPDKLSVTQIKTLIRDPYEIYGRKVLGLNALDPLNHAADAPLRGNIVHDVLEQFVKSGTDPAAEDAADKLMAMADEVLDRDCPWPAMRTLWRARIEGFVQHFLLEETQRRASAVNFGTELWGESPLDTQRFTLTAKADRIDLNEDNEALIYDYKTGTVPSVKEQVHFDKQLLLEAAMVERGAFAALGAVRTKDAVYIGLGSQLKNVHAPLQDTPPQEVWSRFEGLIAKWMTHETGYTSRRSNASTRFAGNFDHLARYGEWDETHDAVPEDLA
ncbi:MAG: double-strand break repair protein AddB [Octadecabacter sp.]|nr:double-strand break repair protein AddB [Octadecabacter sp.]